MRNVSRRLALAFSLIAFASLPACVSVKDEDGALVTRLSRFADEHEVDLLAKRVDEVEQSVVVLRKDSDAADAKVREDVAGWLKRQTDEFVAQMKAGQDAATAAAAATTASLAQASIDAKSAVEAAGAAKAAADTLSKESKEQYEGTIAAFRQNKIGLDALTAKVDAKTGAPEGTTGLIISTVGGILATAAGAYGVNQRSKRKKAEKDAKPTTPAPAAA